MRKIINSTSPKYEDQITEELIFDTAPTVNSFNAVTSDGVARAIAGASGEVPQVTENDNGKVLTAIYDAGGPAVEWGSIPTVDQTYDADSTNAQSGVAVAEAIAGISIPTVDQAYDASSVNAQSGIAVAGAISSVRQVPSSTSGDNGKVLTVNSQGTPAWATPAAPSGGSDEWWGGDPGDMSVPGYGELKILFKDGDYDPRNDPDSTFLNRFSSITKNDDGSYSFVFKKPTSGTDYAYAAFNGKYTGDNEFVILAWETEFQGSYGSWAYTFEGCTGLRAVYNATQGGSNQYDCTRTFYGCTGLTVFRERRAMDPSSSASATVPSSFVKTGTSMFQGCTSLKHVNMSIGKIVSSDSNRGVYTSMFQGCYRLEDGPWMFGQPSNCQSMFAGCRSLRKFNPVFMGEYNAMGSSSQVAYSCDCSGMFGGCSMLEDISALASMFRMVYISNATIMFFGCTQLKSIPFQLTLDPSGALCTNMFNGCVTMEALPDVLDYSLVTGASSMFRGCECLYSIESLANVTWHANLTNVDTMFANCYSLQKGLKDCYDSLSAVATITNHSATFQSCGRVYSNPELAQIPSSWGGTGT